MEPDAGCVQIVAGFSRVGPGVVKYYFFLFCTMAVFVAPPGAGYFRAGADRRELMVGNSVKNEIGVFLASVVDVVGRCSCRICF
jgi:hypothetical protein